MDYSILNPRKALNKAYLKVKASRNDIESFKNNLANLIDSINESESEEFHKNLVSDFLKNTYYGAAHFINTKGRNDLVIHNGAKAADTVGVIIEAKKPTNKGEMVSRENINAKAMQELVLYYLRERITNKNLEIKHLIATNIYEWFVFDASVFEKEFAQNKALVKQFTDFEEGRLSGKTTDFFYKQLAEPAIEGIKHEVAFTHFDIRDYEKPLRNADRSDDSKLIALYKLLAPEHLLKLPFANDSNSLDKGFYTELLHIIGLAEIKEGSKKLIQRKKEGERNEASLMESAIFQLDNLDKLSRIDKPAQYGETSQERLFSVALELTITWVNRILFLKLLEAQLIRYHKGDKAYAFLNVDKVRNFDDLNNLFFSVLARRPKERNDKVKALFANVPYLNSSLFEPTDLEQAGLFISQLTDGALPLLSATVIRNGSGQKRTGELTTIEYIFEFLNAYDFASEGSEEIQEENKRLINASVLGLIFEKINGYKDGSFFTPGFITMYMCRETIRRAVLQKFKEAKGWECADLNQLYDRIADKPEANAIINSLKICDPAVGSGHFLVSALNELIAVKSELKILLDRSGKTLRDYTVEVQNDELIVTDDDGQLFEYNPRNRESQRIQETLFHEKQTIIENCLFGVDLNPNSVKICRLRLWIELLKNAYYKTPAAADGNGAVQPELETLPNIDINIKCGNSLISRYPLDADIKKALKGSRWTIDSYRLAVMSYRNAHSKDEKREMERLINEIKADFESEVAANDKRLLRLSKVKGELLTLTAQTSLFERTKAETATWEKQVKATTKAANELEAELAEIRSNKIYENAFEWRFEFPEVLNNEGDFVGFDVVIGNPPYVLVQSLNDNTLFDFYKKQFIVASYKIDTYQLFYEKSLCLLRSNGWLSFITPNTFLKNKYAYDLRKLLLKQRIVEVVNFYIQVFEDASVDTLIFASQKCFVENNLIKYLNYSKIGCDIVELQPSYHKQLSINSNKLEFEFDISPNEDCLFSKINKFRKIGDFGRAYFGIQTFDRKIYVSNKKENIDYKPIIDGSNVKRYYYESPNEYLLFKKNAIKSGGDESVYNRKRIVVRQIGYYPEGTIVEPNVLTLNTVYNIYLFENNIQLELVLGIINSKLIQFFWLKKFYDNKTTFPKIKKQPLESIPIVESNNYYSQEIISKVNQIILLKKNDCNSNTTSLEAEIDQLVYQLYGLTEEEIKIVEYNNK